MVSGGHRERGERERDREHTSPRGTGSPRGQGRGAWRGSGLHSAPSRSQHNQHRDKATNGSSAAPTTSSNTDSAWPPATSSTKASPPDTAPPDGWGPSTSAEAGEDPSVATTPAILPEDNTISSGNKPDESAESIQLHARPASSEDQGPPPAMAAPKTQSKPASYGRSWADVAKYVLYHTYSTISRNLL